MLIVKLIDSDGNTTVFTENSQCIPLHERIRSIIKLTESLGSQGDAWEIESDLTGCIVARGYVRSSPYHTTMRFEDCKRAIESTIEHIDAMFDSISHDYWSSNPDDELQNIWKSIISRARR